MRHAKSNWDNSEVSDFERPLNEFGLKAAPFMGNVIYKYDFKPELIISSPAKRAKQTAVLVKAVAEIKIEIEFRDELYGARPAAFLEVTSTIAEDKNTVLIIGHNPELENFIYKLTGETQKMPTASFALINLNINEWKDIKNNCGRLELIARPRDLMERVEVHSVFQTN